MGDKKMELKIVEIHKGGTIFKEGYEGNCAYLIKSGTVNIYKMIKNKKISLTKMTAGQILGEMAVINKETRSASAEALEFCELIQIDDLTLKSALNKSMPIVKGMTEQLIHRCREKDKEVREQMSGDIFLSMSHLINLILSQHPDIYYADLSKIIKSILCVSQLKIDTIVKKLCNLQLLTIIPAPRNKKIISIEDSERFIKGAVALDKEINPNQEQEDEYIDIFEFAKIVDSNPEKIFDKIGKGKIPKSFIFISKEQALEWLDDVGMNYFKSEIPTD
ncbi:MAG: cyclic nucleotide-binding domain-containing protein [Desulfobacteraceae bacterium]|nr:cyclic nucleotide-binding domain-containing protein [Desulfobacteraceae bacterium]